MKFTEYNRRCLSCSTERIEWVDRADGSVWDYDAPGEPGGRCKACGSTEYENIVRFAGKVSNDLKGYPYYDHGFGRVFHSETERRAAMRAAGKEESGATQNELAVAVQRDLERQVRGKEEAARRAREQRERLEASPGYAKFRQLEEHGAFTPERILQSDQPGFQWGK